MEPQKDPVIQFERDLKARLVRGRVQSWVNQGEVPTRFKRSASPHWTFYCPMCGSSRMAKSRPNPYRIRIIGGVALFTLLWTLALWTWMGFKGIFFFFVFWSVTEVIYRLMVRAELPCDLCGFDPVLYLSRPSNAIAVVVKHCNERYGVEKNLNQTSLNEARAP